MPSRTVRFWAAAGLLVLSAGCTRGRSAGSAAPDSPNAATTQPPPTQVSVTLARQQTLTESIEITGALSALHDVTVGVKSGGRIVAVYAREGEVVRAGQIVAQQDLTDLNSQLAQQRASLATAQSRVASARVALADARTNVRLTDQQTQSTLRQSAAALDAARQQGAVVKAGARAQERQLAEENATAARVERDRARADLKRYRDLYRQDAVAAQQLDQAQASADAADARYNAASQNASLVREGSRPEDIRRAQAAVDQAVQTVAAARANRTQVALRRADVQSALESINAAQAGVAQAQALVRLAEQAIREASIRSPIDGVVAERKVEPGMQLSAAKPDVMRIVSLDSIYFDGQISETQYSRVRTGQSVAVTVDALPGKSFQGSISQLFPVASAAARTITARISLRNEGRILRPQMFARGRIVTAVHANSIVIPRDAILDPANSTGRIFVVKGGVAEERKVATGPAQGLLVEVTSGNVKPADAVVTVGQGQLQTGDRVQFAPPAGSR